MKYYTMGFILIFFSFCSILILLYFGGITRQVEKDIYIIKSKINNLKDDIQVNELEFVAHTNPSYIRKLAKIYLVTNYDENEDLNIIGIQDFKAKSMHKIFMIKENQN